MQNNSKVTKSGNNKPKVKRPSLVTKDFFLLPNSVAETLAKAGLGKDAGSVIWFIIRKTYGFNKLYDWLPTKQIIEGTGLSKRAVMRGIAELRKKGLIRTDKDKNFWKHKPNKVSILVGRAQIRKNNMEKNGMNPLPDDVKEDEQVTKSTPPGSTTFVTRQVTKSTPRRGDKIDTSLYTTYNIQHTTQQTDQHKKNSPLGLTPLRDKFIFVDEEEIEGDENSITEGIDIQLEYEVEEELQRLVI